MRFKIIYLLVWKNFIFRRKHIFSTFGLIILPMIVSLIVRLVLGNLENFENFMNNIENKLESDLKIQEVISIPEKITYDNDTDLFPIGTSIRLAYAPKSNPNAKYFMEKLEIALEEIYEQLSIGDKLAESRPYPSEASILNEVDTWKGKRLPFRAAVIFPDDLTWNPNVILYKIRVIGIDFLTESLILPPAVSEKIRRFSPHSKKELYPSQTFRMAQIALNRVIVERFRENKSPIPRIEFQEFPSRKPTKKAADLSKIVPHMIVLSFILCVPNIIRGIIHEKQSGIKEFMKMMGLSNWMHWTGWMIDSLFFLIITLVFMTIILFAPGYFEGAISHCDVIMWFVILLLYFVATITFVFFISTIFVKPTLAIVGGLFFFIVSYYGLVFVLDREDIFAPTLTEKLASSLLPNMALHWALKIIIDHEVRKVDIGWSNLTEPYSAFDEINLLAICGMLLVDIVLYMIFTVYMENVIPSEFGLTKPWYYPFQLSTWCSRKKVVPLDNSQKNAPSNEQPGFEEEPTDLTVGIEICSLIKKFKRKVAIDGFCAKIYSGEITALLGHNGAGKTTILSILTGMDNPSSGTAFINGYNVVNQRTEIRQFVGLCPQNDLLFDELTVAQHLQFFGMLKGLTSSTAKQEAKKILLNLKLEDKAKSLASKLSGGEKRRLSLANSIVGGSSVLFLDEPTSGLDPEIRREVWDLLLTLRTEGRTIVLTTHFMEEADVLGDRILIMADGKLQCSGTPLFLKKSFGDGYTLTVTLTDKADKNSILSVVQKYISTASFKKGKDKSFSEVGITLPEESTQTSIFPDMFSDLTKNQQKLGILTMGLAISSVDDVFLRVGELSHPTERVDSVDNEGTSNVDNFESAKGSSLVCLMFQGLMAKLFLRNFRNIRLILLQLLPPITAAIIVAILTSVIFKFQLKDYPPLKISLRSYKDPITLCMPMTPAEDYVCKYFFETTEGIGTTTIVHPDKQNPNLVTFLLNEGNSDDKERRKNFKWKYIIAAEVRNDTTLNKLVIKVMHSGSYIHSEPLALNAAYNTLLKMGGNGTGLSTSPKIEVTNHPIRRKLLKDLDEVIKTAESVASKLWAIVAIFNVLLCLPFAMLGATYLMFPSEERVCKGKQLQLMAGVSPPLYWITSFLLDLFMMILVVVAMLISFAIFEPNALFTTGDGTRIFVIICIVYAFSAIPLSYLRSNFLTPSKGFSGLVILHFTTALVITNLAFICELLGEIKIASETDTEDLKNVLTSFSDATNAFGWLGLILRIFFIFNPTFGLTMCFLKFAAISVENSRCILLPPDDLEKSCSKIYGGKNKTLLSFLNRTFGSESLLKTCCISCPENIAKCGAIQQCRGKLEYLTWKFESSYLHVRVADIFPITSISCEDADKMAGIGQELFWMFFFGVIYYILLFIVEYGVLGRIKQYLTCRKSLSAFKDNYPTDEDVIAEAERVHATVFRQQSQPVDKKVPIGTENVAPSEIVSGYADVLQAGDKNDDVEECDELQNLNEVAAKSKQEAVEILIEQDSLLVQNLCKSYGRFAAVSNISFGVKHGECFGLLGVNGAGKTVVLRILTGDEFPSVGDAFIANISLKKDRNNFIKQIGYCPQIDPFIGFMTGREVLNFYGRLRGVPSGSLKKETSKWLNKLGLTEAGNTQCKTYSRGMKRRLSAGLAMIGNPPIILLDAPTSGVDPVSRRDFWKVISSVKNAGQSVIFTSQSMDECEALCSRLGIMVNGQFQCFGGTPHLKKKFGEGYTLTIKLKSNIPVDNPETDKLMDNAKAVTKLQEAISSKYQRIFLKQVHSNIMQYQLLDGSMTWDVVFKIMEEIKAGHEIIDVYSIGETTLEQLYLTFARKQKGARGA